MKKTQEERNLDEISIIISNALVDDLQDNDFEEALRDVSLQDLEEVMGEIKEAFRLEISLFNLICDGRFKVLKYFVEIEKFEVNDQDRLGNTLLYVAGLHNKLEIFKYLVDKGANIDNSTIESILSTGNLEMLKYLVEKGKININAKDSKGNTLLNLAIKGGCLEIFKYLVDKGANIDTSVTVCLVLGDKSTMLEYLVEKGKTDINAKDSDDNPLLDLAIMYGGAKIFQYLVDEGVNIEASIIEYHDIWDNSGMLTHLLEEEKIGIDAIDSKGNTLLDLAIMHKNQKIFEYLTVRQDKFDDLKYESLTPKMLAFVNVAKTIRNICSLQKKATDSEIKVLQGMEVRDLDLLAKDIFTNYLIKNGIPDGYLGSLGAYLPEVLKKGSILPFLGKLMEVSAELSGVECKLLYLTVPELSSIVVPYSVVLDCNELYSGQVGEQTGTLPIVEFYNNNPEFKVPGNYLLKMLKQGSPVEGVDSYLNYLMLANEDLVELVKLIDLNEFANICHVSSRIKNKLIGVVNKHKEYEGDKNLKNACIEGYQKEFPTTYVVYKEIGIITLDTLEESGDSSNEGNVKVAGDKVGIDDSH